MEIKYCSALTLLFTNIPLSIRNTNFGNKLDWLKAQFLNIWQSGAKLEAVYMLHVDLRHSDILTVVWSIGRSGRVLLRRQIWSVPHDDWAGQRGSKDKTGGPDEELSDDCLKTDILKYIACKCPDKQQQQPSLRTKTAYWAYIVIQRSVFGNDWLFGLNVWFLYLQSILSIQLRYVTSENVGGPHNCKIFRSHPRSFTVKRHSIEMTHQPVHCSAEHEVMLGQIRYWGWSHL